MYIHLLFIYQIRCRYLSEIFVLSINPKSIYLRSCISLRDRKFHQIYSHARVLPFTARLT